MRLGQRGLGSGFVDVGDEVERFLNFLCGTGPVGLQIAESGHSVVPGVGEAARARQKNSDVVAGQGGTIEIAGRFLAADGLPVMMQRAIKLTGFSIDRAQLAVNYRQLLNRIGRRQFQSLSIAIARVIQKPQRFGF